jgi:single-stranded DNA-binding protein
MGRLQQRSWTAEDGSARSTVEVIADELGAEPAVGNGDHDQDDEEPGPLANSTSAAGERDAGEGAACQRSAPPFPILRVSREEFSTTSRPALRAAFGRLRPGDDATVAGRRASPSTTGR